MKLEASIHLEDWDISDDNDDPTISTYEKGKLKIISTDGILNLYIKSSDGKFNHIKEIHNYWEIMSYDIFLNDDIVSDQENAEFQLELMNNIRDNFINFETLIFTKRTGYIFGVNNLIDSEGWNDKSLERMWENDEIIVIDMLEDVDPKILTKKGWENINVNQIGEDMNISRERSIDEIL